MKYDIGIIGGGQLGMMMVEEAHKMGFKTIVLDPSENCSCSKISDKFIKGDFNDLTFLEKLAKECSVLSYEFENVHADILKKLDSKYNIKQGILPLLDSQDRLREKNNANKYGLTTCKYYDCSSKSDLFNIIKKIDYPFIYKTRRDGYDGHGQVLINNKDDLIKLDSYLDKTDGIIEEKIDFDYECSIVLIRDKEKAINFPISRNIHKNGILDVSIIPASINKKLEKEIIDKSKQFMIDANYYGILTIEYFVKDNEFYFNEMAPRPHNSGHYTIEGCNTNQFRELDKFLMGIKLTAPILNSNTIMKNILGRDLINLDKLIQIPDGTLHMYHKLEERPLRKLGHITYTNLTFENFLKYKNELKIED